jgi:hypothetical protein
MIDVELYKEDHGLIPQNYNRNELKPLKATTDCRIKLGSSVNQILAMKKKGLAKNKTLNL